MVNNNVFQTGNYSEETKAMMAKIEEENFEFELIETLIGYISKMGEPGAILVFLPGWTWIFAMMKTLQNHPVFGGPSFIILPLHSSLPREEQRKV